ncbi:scavenger receptor cysteine-rich type 1 protein M130 [Chanos chanos]|uniref:Scavenger receptor cysteine-rich type 1 protein M130 n=1 Tax=Chanos chanos TaxID=29144 RepID=A0A6J2W6F9_CHACN|nr:scavenger receptor cysteine-rich type 1 protein M130-like [Chanos chanos]
MWALLLLLHVSSIQARERLILRGGSSPCVGRLDVYHDRQWGVVGHTDWNKHNGEVACRTLGCGNLTKVNPGYRYDQDLPDKVWMDKVSCRGHETNLWDCSFPGWGAINSKRDIQLGLNYDGQRDQCAGLVEFSTPNGKINVCHENNPTWADKVCEALKCGKAQEGPGDEIVSGEGLTLKTMRCDNVEKFLWQCVRLTETESCTRPAYVICRSGDNVCAGYIEVQDSSKASEWVPLCQANLSSVPSPDNLCSMMNCGASVSMEPEQCNGTGNVMLTCTDHVKPVLMTKGTETKCYGNIFVKQRNSKTLGVCFGSSKEKAEKLGKVVCGELGCGEVVFTGQGEITQSGWMSNVQCQGQEASMWHCLAKHERRRAKRCQTTNIICEKSVNVRLRDGFGSCSGRVEVELEGSWWSVDLTGWTQKNTDVVCTAVKCGKAQEYDSKLFIDGSRPTLQWELTCDSSSNSIHQCIKLPKRKPQPKDYVKVICEEEAVVYLQGDSACSGEVRIRSGGKHYRLSGSLDTWHNRTASVVCKQMQCGALSSLNRSPGIGSDAQLWKISYNCSSGDESLGSCSKIDSATQNTSEIATVQCTGEVKVSLKGEHCAGKVEVCRNGVCGGICNKIWTKEQSQMVCQNLNCGDFITNQSFSTGDKTVKFSSVYCAPNISSLSQCNFVPNDGSSCTNNPVYVTCTDSVKVRLQDPRDSCAGKVELFYSGQWLPVCKDSLDENAQNTICKVLECGSLADYTDVRYGDLPAIGLGQVTCKKDADSISGCNLKDIAGPKQGCNIGRLNCTDEPVVNLTHKCFGEVMINGMKVCGEHWDNEMAAAVCHEKGCGNSISFEKVSSRGGKAPHFHCTGQENKLRQCGSVNANCKSFVSVVCDDSIEFRLTEKCGGVLQIWYKNEWEHVCPLNGEQKEVADKLCKELKCGNSSQSTSEDYAYVPPTPPPPVNLIVGVTLGLLLVLVALAILFWQRKRLLFILRSACGTEDDVDVETNHEMKSIESDDKGSLMRKGSDFETDDYEDIDSSMIKNSEMEPKTQVSTSAPDEEEEGDHEDSSGTEYDDIDDQAIEESSLLQANRDDSTAPQLPMRPAELLDGVSCGAELQESQDDYDDAETSFQVVSDATEGYSNSDRGMNPVDSSLMNPEEDYLQPDQEE